jgi:uncharacterized damage-inducible protein DinB
MSIGIEKLLGHMAWANQKLIAALADLPNEALSAFATDPEWKVAEILRHFMSSADWYGWRVTGEDHIDFPAPTQISELSLYAELAATFDDRLLRASREPDLVFQSPGYDRLRARSTIISQAVHHATEHRAQIVSALEAQGFKSISLDGFDLWEYCNEVGE